VSEREPISKKLRFEIFKRDKFSCQYCGAKAPDVVLHVDHIRPVVEGGGNDPLNLVAACQGCNSGKGARLLDDSSVIERQRNQIAELDARREQLQMILEWRDELERVKTDTVQIVCERIGERGGFEPNENGRSDVRRWLKKYTFEEVLVGVDEAFDIYMKWNRNQPDKAAWHKAFGKIPAVCSIKRQSVEKPYLQQLFYVQGILRRRFRDRLRYVGALEDMIQQWGADADLLESLAKVSDDWEHFNHIVFAACDERATHEEENGAD
jgi:hypothetical protein